MSVPDTIAWAKPEDVGMSRERLGRLTDLFAADIERGRIPGVVTLIARHGRVVHFKAQGRRAPDRDETMELDAIFRIYSMTKPIVSVALMMLAEEGRLLVSDPVSAYVPEFADTRVGVERDGRLEEEPLLRPITIQDLLRHTAGLTYEWIHDGIVEDLYLRARVGRRSLTNADQSPELAKLPLVAQPGTMFTYSRATDVVARIVEVVAGKPIGAFLRERIFEPLGMLETGFVVPPDYHGRLAEAFPTDPDTGEEVQLLDVRADVKAENGGGGLASTASDYARFMHMLSAGGALDGTRILSPKTLALMAADHLGPEVTIRGDLLPVGYGFGLGFMVRRQAGIASFPGSTGDYGWEGLGGTSFWIDPAEGLAALLMVQAPGQRVHYRRLFRQLVYAALVE